MSRAMRRVVLAAAFLAPMAATAGRAQAEMIVGFRYEGRGGPDFAGLIATGTGTFSFADGLGTVGLADLTSFEFTLDETTPNATTFDLANLTSFSASVSPGLSMTSLALSTGAVQGMNQETEPRLFDVSSLGPSGASTSFEILGLTFEQTTGAVAITSVNVVVPEPSSGAMAAIGALIVAGGWSRRREARATA